MLQDAQIATEENLVFRSNMYGAGEDHVYDEVTSGTSCVMQKLSVVHTPTMNTRFFFYHYILTLLVQTSDEGLLFSPIVVQCLNFLGEVTRKTIGKKVVSFFPKLKVIVYVFKTYFVHLL